MEDPLFTTSIDIKNIQVKDNAFFSESTVKRQLHEYKYKRANAKGANRLPFLEGDSWARWNQAVPVEWSIHDSFYNYIIFMFQTRWWQCYGMGTHCWQSLIDGAADGRTRFSLSCFSLPSVKCYNIDRMVLQVDHVSKNRESNTFWRKYNFFKK